MEKVTAIYFSPTGNSKKYVTLLAEKIALPFDTLDFTKEKMMLYFQKKILYCFRHQCMQEDCLISICLIM